MYHVNGKIKEDIECPLDICPSDDIFRFLRHGITREFDINGNMISKKLYSYDNLVKILFTTDIKIEDVSAINIKNLKYIDSETCIICMTAKKDVCITKCGHYNCCKTCLSKISFCPICRAAYNKETDLLKIFE